MRAVLLKPGKYARVVDIKPTYSSLRDALGGNIEMTYPFPDEYIAVLTNEEARLMDLRPNRARRVDGAVVDIYYGSMIVVGLMPEGEYADLTRDEIELIMQEWLEPETRDNWAGYKPQNTALIGGVYA